VNGFKDSHVEVRSIVCANVSSLTAPCSVK